MAGLSFERHVPKLLSRLRARPRMSWALLRNIRKRDRTYRLDKSHSSSINIKYVKNLVKEEVENAVTNFIENLVTQEFHSVNSKPLFNSINKSQGQSRCLENIPWLIPLQTFSFQFFTMTTGAQPILFPYLGVVSGAFHVTTDHWFDISDI